MRRLVLPMLPPASPVTMTSTREVSACAAVRPRRRASVGVLTSTVGAMTSRSSIDGRGVLVETAPSSSAADQQSRATADPLGSACRMRSPAVTPLASSIVRHRRARARRSSAPETKRSVLDAEDVCRGTPEDLVLLLGCQAGLVERLHPVGQLAAHVGHIAV